MFFCNSEKNRGLLLLVEKGQLSVIVSYQVIIEGISFLVMYEIFSILAANICRLW